ncbi:methyl-accepting chemotaxis sensory transducer with Cache sensor [Oceanobacillus limi]|uniref:Methyl-accepting chemotaxis sensory transducer with Cache sensor n=1 Tax=Oceanobacillus limi TaxID=930131 RepID=A0A1I0HA13_9BACI|nr:methyl-accepting chemotaxis protein [Oceanobacillus limi]SET80531.1 methyl-accepting chemotaxis sensory transducer with Cache sensor [Oceanobacillus limi]
MKNLMGKLPILWKIMVILPFIIVFLAILTFISYNNASNELNQAIDERMDSKLKETVERVNIKLTTHERNLVTTKALIESQDTYFTKAEYRAYFENLLPSNEETFGLGVWYEPYQYNEDEEFFGPYVYKDGDNTVYTEEYEVPSYNYPEIDWYKQGKQSDRPVWTAPYYDETLDQTFITTAVSFKDKRGSLQGVITSDYVLDSIQGIISEIQVEDSGYAVLVDQDGNFIAHPDSDKLLSSNLSDELNDDSMIDTIVTEDNGKHTAVVAGSEYELHYETLPKVGWKIVLLAPTDELYSSLPILLNQLLITSGVLILLIVIIVFIIGKTVSKDVQGINRQLEVLAQGDLTTKINTTSKDEFGQMGQYFNRSVSSLQSMLTKIGQSTDHVAATSEQLSASSQEINSSVEEVASSIQEVADAASSQNELANDLSTSNGSMRNNMARMEVAVKSMEEEANQSTKLAGDGSEMVKEVIEKMKQLNEQITSSSQKIYALESKSNQIGEMANLITDVTEQTNLLALNAAIEAARAGEAGKGFAVVAEEVRKLAEQSGKASQEINEIINGIQLEVSQSVSMMERSQHIAGEGIQSVEKTGQSFEEITSSIFSLSSKISSMTTEMTTSLSDMDTMNDLSNKMQKYSESTNDHAHSVSAVTEEQMSMMAEVANASESLAELAQQLQEEMAKFKI